MVKEVKTWCRVPLPVSLCHPTSTILHTRPTWCLLKWDPSSEVLKGFKTPKDSRSNFLNHLKEPPQLLQLYQKSPPPQHPLHCCKLMPRVSSSWYVAARYPSGLPHTWNAGDYSYVHQQTQRNSPKKQPTERAGVLGLNEQKWVIIEAIYHGSFILIPSYAKGSASLWENSSDSGLDDTKLKTAPSIDTSGSKNL